MFAIFHDYQRGSKLRAALRPYAADLQALFDRVAVFNNQRNQIAKRANSDRTKLLIEKLFSSHSHPEIVRLIYQFFQEGSAAGLSGLRSKTLSPSERLFVAAADGHRLVVAAAAPGEQSFSQRSQIPGVARGLFAAGEIRQPIKQAASLTAVVWGRSIFRWISISRFTETVASLWDRAMMAGYRVSNLEGRRGLTKRAVKKITIELLDEDLQAISTAFADLKDPQAAPVALAELAVHHFASWISGARRHRSLSEQYADWIQSLYERLLPDEAPSVYRLYNAFNMPYGQAQYIARVLREKSLKKWRLLAVKELKAALGVHRKAAADFEKKGEADQMLAVRISKLANTELARLCDELTRSDPGFLPPRDVRGYGDTRVVEIPARTIIALLPTLETL
jgi:hypothetical protein